MFRKGEKTLEEMGGGVLDACDDAQLFLRSSKTTLGPSPVTGFLALERFQLFI